MTGERVNDPPTVLSIKICTDRDMNKKRERKGKESQ